MPSAALARVHVASPQGAQLRCWPWVAGSAREAKRPRGDCGKWGRGGGRALRPCPVQAPSSPRRPEFSRSYPMPTAMSPPLMQSQETTASGILGPDAEGGHGQGPGRAGTECAGWGAVRWEGWRSWGHWVRLLLLPAGPLWSDFALTLLGVRLISPYSLLQCPGSAACLVHAEQVFPSACLT